MTKREKRGMVVLIGIIFIIQIVRIGYPLQDIEVYVGRFPEVKAQTVKREVRKYKQRPLVRIHINQADSAEWVKLRGIGPVLARRIIKFRAALGGFVSVEQVGETFGLKDSVFQSIKGQLICSGELDRLKINVAEWEELNSHPYIDSKQAGAIVYYRRNRGNIQDSFEFKRMLVFDSINLIKILPYLDFSVP
jgi:DNA uptake protein ComE-like DNA-binding protein